MIRNDYDYLLKFILIGDSNVGKSCLLMRLLEGKFKSQHQPTLGVQFGSKMFTINDTKLKTQIWDTAGQQSFKSITRAYYKGSIAAILVFDLTSSKSFDNLSNWLYEIKNHSHQKIHLVLIGNKKDLQSQREVSEEEVEKFIKDNSIEIYYETSAFSGENVEKPFHDISLEILKKIHSGEINVKDGSTSGVKPGLKPKNIYPSNSSDIKLDNLKQKKKDEPKKNCC